MNPWVFVREARLQVILPLSALSIHSEGSPC